MERLDRVFINLCWDELLPNTILSSLTRTTSDHVPLKIDISTTIPKSAIFRFENYWIHSPGFSDVVASAWNCWTSNSDPAAVIVAKLKSTRSALRTWRKSFCISPNKKLTARLLSIFLIMSRSFAPYLLLKPLFAP